MLCDSLKSRSTCTENQSNSKKLLDRGWGQSQRQCLERGWLVKKSMMTLILALCNSALEYKQCAHAVKV